MKPIEEKGDHVLLRVRVQPRASRDAVAPMDDGRYRVALTAPPVEGKANNALIAFMAHQLGIRKHALALAAGDASRDKTLRIDGLTIEEVRRRLA